MVSHRNFVYDGSFEGLLTTVFKFFEYKLTTATIVNRSAAQEHLFFDSEVITTNTQESNRVWKGLTTQLKANGQQLVYYAFLSELKGADQLILDFVIAVFNKEKLEFDVAHPITNKLMKIKKQVSRERHRMTAFVRFRLTKDEIYFASVEPDFNVLPLISTHFKNRFTDQKWLIYDVKRHYGIYYDLKKVTPVDFQFDHNFDFTKTSHDLFTMEELEFQTMWQHYFKSVNIESRKNLKLHTQHVPKRYWKYLSEKQV
jgi:probable DNA metabolism protein